MSEPASSRSETADRAVDSDTAGAPKLSEPAVLLQRLGAARFSWDLTSDVMVWSDTDHLFGSIEPASLGTGSDFSRLIEPSGSVRFDAIHNSTHGDRGEGVRYNLEYCVRSRASADPLWIEETGCWFAGSDGRPLRAEGIVQFIGERRAREEQLQRLARHDPLTGELNRNHLMAELAAALEEASRFRSSFAFMLIGVDHLGQINDAFGVDVADQVIMEVAQRLRARLRSGDILARASGNKFGVILKNCRPDEMTVAAARFLSAIRSDIMPTPSGPVALTGSVGAVSAPRYARTADEAMVRAQEALGSARKRRRGSCIVWRPSPEREAQRQVNVRVTHEIVSALNERRVLTVLEPVVRASDRSIAFHESLVRMRSDDGTLLLAPDIVTVAEKLGLIRLIDQRVLELVFDDLAAAPQAHLSVNVSPETTCDPDWWSRFEALRVRYPGVAERLIVEITETAEVRNIDDLRAFVTPLKLAGVRIAIDDFGAGNTSFRNLRRLGVDLVKIDGEFVQNLSQSADDRAFVRSMIELAQRLGLDTVAEWVQDDESAAMLQEWGCTYLQGRLVGQAVIRRPWLDADGTATGRQSA